MPTHWDNSFFVGERLCLDFVNTLSDWNNPEAAIDRIPDFDSFVTWLAFARTLARDEIKWEIGFESADEEIKQRVMADVRCLREKIHSVFYPIIKGSRPDSAVLSQIYTILSNVVLFVKPEPCGKAEWNSSHVRILKPSGLLYPIAFSATRLLVDDCLCYVKNCGDASCGWFFLDCSKSHKRRWCDMKTCGNRNKARRHYAKMCETCP
jgi:predicted RNA-binding Zn ribbon-like protein